MSTRTVAQDHCSGRWWLAAVLALASTPSPAESGTEPADSGAPAPVYRPGGGYRFGDSGLALGGYATADGEWLEHKNHYSSVAANLFVFYSPVSFARLFADLEIPTGGFERVHLEASLNDAVNLRVGKLLTPFGRWNVSHIEPLVWTASEPLLVETVFDDTVSGAMLHGTLFPSGGALSYSVYGSLFEPINADSDEAVAERLAGGHLEWASLYGWTVGASWVASQLDDGHWNNLAGVDWLWQPNPRFELSGEILAGRGSRHPDTLSGGYIQAAIETFPKLHAVFRYEHFAPENASQTVNLYDAGLAWVPLSFLRVKLDYLHTDRTVSPAEPGVRASLSFLF